MGSSRSPDWPRGHLEKPEEKPIEYSTVLEVSEVPEKHKIVREMPESILFYRHFLEKPGLAF